MKSLKLTLSVLLTLAGIGTIFLTLSLLLNLFGIREWQGVFVHFVVYANLLCGIIYLLAAYGLRNQIQKSIDSLLLALVLLFIVFIGLQIFISHGGLYETKTVNGLIFRIAFTAIMYGTAVYISKKESLKFSHTE